MQGLYKLVNCLHDVFGRGWGKVWLCTIFVKGMSPPITISNGVSLISHRKNRQKLNIVCYHLENIIRFLRVREPVFHLTSAHFLTQKMGKMPVT